MQALIPFPDISSEIFSISLFGFDLALRWYALAYIAGILLAWRISVRAVRNSALWNAEGPPMDERQVEDFLTWAILGVILGGRLGYVIFYDPQTYLNDPIAIIRFWDGGISGMAFHGGVVGVALAGFVYARSQNLRKFSTADLIVLGIPVGLGFGRLANFINAELWGRPTDLPWGVAFPGSAAQDCGQLVALCARHPSQLYEALLEGAVLLAVLIWQAWRRNALKVPGRITGLFLAGYGIARFLIEFVRQPDAQFVTDGNPLGLAFHIAGYGLTMGQILSVPMILLGIWLVSPKQRATV